MPGIYHVHVFIVLLLHMHAGAELGFGQEDYTQMEDRGSVEIEVIKLDANNERIVVEIVTDFHNLTSLPLSVISRSSCQCCASRSPSATDGIHDKEGNQTTRKINAKRENLFAIIICIVDYVYC